MPTEIIRSPMGGMIICKVSRPSGPKKCFYCSGIGSQLCDFKLPDGKTCDRPCCLKHSTHVGLNRDFCKDHASMQK